MNTSSGSSAAKPSESEMLQSMTSSTAILWGVLTVSSGQHMFKSQGGHLAPPPPMKTCIGMVFTHLLPQSATQTALHYLKSEQQEQFSVTISDISMISEHLWYLVVGRQGSLLEVPVSF